MSALNPAQRAALLTGALVLTLLVLFADGMNWDGISAIGIGGVATIAGLIYVLRGSDHTAGSGESLEPYTRDDTREDSGRPNYGTSSSRLQVALPPGKRFVVRAPKQPVRDTSSAEGKAA